MVDAYRRYREGRREVAAAPSEDPRKVVLFAACKPNESAFETDGHGDFTRIAAPLLTQRAGRLSNEDFQRELIRAFGESPRQHPEIDCSLSSRTRRLLGVRRAVSGGDETDEPEGPRGLPDFFRAPFGRRSVDRFTREYLRTSK